MARAVSAGLSALIYEASSSRFSFSRMVAS
jgi:hypothetical protein